MKLTYEQIRNDKAAVIDFIEAVANGKQVQYRYNDDVTWNDCVMYGTFLQDRGVEYRIKPSPKLRPWKPEEVPVGALLKSEYNQEFLIVGRKGAWNGSVLISEINIIKGGWQSFTTEGCMYSLDHGKTWLPCGVLE